MKKKLNSYLEDFYIDLYIESGLSAAIDFKSFLLGRKDVPQSTFNIVYSKYDTLRIMYEWYCDNLHTYIYDDIVSPYYLYIHFHTPFTTKFQNKLNILLREKKINKLLK